MASWRVIERSAPELAARARAAFDAHRHKVLATLRRDGSPRISAIDASFDDGELWLGMMPDSRKAQDLERDPRLALHSATIDKEVREGDAKLSGRGLLVDDDATWQRYLAALKEQAGPVPEGRFPVFRVDVAELSMLRPAGNHLDIAWWREGEEVRRVERR